MFSKKNNGNSLSPQPPQTSPNPASFTTPAATTHYPPSPRLSPRPAYEERLASKPALRIRRVSRAGLDGLAVPATPGPSALTPNLGPGPSASPALSWNDAAGVATPSTTKHSRKRRRTITGASPRPPFATAAAPGTQSGDTWPRNAPNPTAAATATLTDSPPTVAVPAHAGGQLTPVPEVTVTSPAGSTARAPGTGPSPQNSVPIPAQSPLRREPLLATEADTLPVPANASAVEEKKGWKRFLPFGKREKKTQGEYDGAVSLEPGVYPRDYAVGAGDPLRQGQVDQQQYAEDIVDWLDVIDPEVATVSTLSNVQNSLFLPDLGGWYNRAPIINLNLAERRHRRDRRQQRAPHRGTPAHVSAFAPPDEVARQEAVRRGGSGEESASPAPTGTDRYTATQEDADPPTPSWGSPPTPGPLGASPEIPRQRRRRWSNVSSSSSEEEGAAESAVARARREADSSSESESDDDGLDRSSMSSEEQEMRRRERLMRSNSTIKGQYAVLPAGIVWDDWSEEEKAELDDHVRHLMHSRRERFRRRMRGFWQFVKQPVGFLITLYAFLITFWGTAWVLFLIGWIYVGGRQRYFIEIADQILTALFCVVGIGLAPFRVVDTYHMIFIAHYHHLTWRLRRERNMPKLNDKNDLPAPQALDPDLEAQFQKEKEAPVLTDEQQRKLTYHQMKYHKSHTFYRPHETPTHRAFPLDLLVVITCLLDCHSMLQMALGGTTWGIKYTVRPPALTATILSCSISCNITAGILISIGTRRTRKKEEVEKRLRQALTEEAMARIEKERKEAEKERRKEVRARLQPASERNVGLTGTISRRVDKVAEMVGRDRRNSEDSGRDPLSPGKQGSTDSPRSGNNEKKLEEDTVTPVNGRASPDSPEDARKMNVPQ